MCPYLVHCCQGSNANRFPGQDVYRQVFRKYCRRGGPLQSFNVAEIVDKAVGIRNQFLKLAAQDGEDVEQWLRDIPDPRIPPTLSE